MNRLAVTDEKVLFLTNKRILKTVLKSIKQFIKAERLKIIPI